MFEELNVNIKNIEISKACWELNLNRSGGPDYLINDCFKYGATYFMTYLNKLFNKILDSGYFPEKLSEKYVIPVHKKGDMNNPANYRGITLLSVMGKLFTRILKK